MSRYEGTISILGQRTGSASAYSSSRNCSTVRPAVALVRFVNRNLVFHRTFAGRMARLLKRRRVPAISARATAARSDAVERSAGWHCRASATPTPRVVGTQPSRHQRETRCVHRPRGSVPLAPTARLCRHERPSHHVRLDAQLHEWTQAPRHKGPSEVPTASRSILPRAAQKSRETTRVPARPVERGIGTPSCF